MHRSHHGLFCKIDLEYICNESVVPYVTQLCALYCYSQLPEITTISLNKQYFWVKPLWGTDHMFLRAYPLQRICCSQLYHFYFHVSLSPAWRQQIERICVPLPSSFLFRGHSSWLFNLIMRDWWHQAQSCADLIRKPALGISWDEEQWDSADQSVSRSDRTTVRHTVDELLGASTFLWLLGTPPFNR